MCLKKKDSFSAGSELNAIPEVWFYCSAKTPQLFALSIEG